VPGNCRKPIDNAELHRSSDSFRYTLAIAGGVRYSPTHSRKAMTMTNQPITFPADTQKAFAVDMCPSPLGHTTAERGNVQALVGRRAS